jgi:hypothetical protein
VELPLFVREFPLFPRELTKFQTKKGFSILNQGFFATELVKSVTQLTKFVMELVKSVTDLSLSGSNLVFSVANEITFGSDQGFSTRDFVKSMPDQGTFPPEEGDTQRNKMPIRPESWRNLSGEIAFETDFLIGPVPANIGAQWRSERHHGDVAGFFQGS